MELKKSTWLNKDELEQISSVLTELGETELAQQLNEYLEDMEGINSGDNFTTKGSFFGGAYLLNLTGVDVDKIIELNEKYDLLNKHDGD